MIAPPLATALCSGGAVVSIFPFWCTRQKQLSLASSPFNIHLWSYIYYLDTFLGFTFIRNEQGVF